MGYTTEFEGNFAIEPALSTEHLTLFRDIAGQEPQEHKNQGRPGTYCQWAPNLDGTALEWDGGEKFYEYVAWLRCLLDMLKHFGYQVNGQSFWYGDDRNDRGRLDVKDNALKVYKATVEQVEEVTFSEVTH